MSLPRKLLYFALAIVVLIGLVSFTRIYITPSVQAVSYNLQPFSSNPVVSLGSAPVVADSGAAVIYDGQYKMWYVETSIDDTIRADLYSHLSANLKSHLNVNNFSAVAASDSADVKAFLDYLKSLNTTQLNAYINSITTTVKYATSTSGTSWTIVGSTNLTPSAGWDKFISSLYVINDASTYKMWYAGNTINVTDLQNLFSAIDPVGLTAPQIATLLNDIFNGHITQLHSDIISFSLQTATGDILTKSLAFLNTSQPKIGYASSPSTDGTNWTKSGSNPVLMTGGWDNIGVMTPAVIKNADGSYDMWYTGISISLSLANLSTATNVAGVETALLGGVNMAIGHAHAASGNGDSGWAKDGSPVLSKGNLSDWDNYGVFGPAVIKNTDGSYDMWYTGIKGNLTTFSSFLASPSSLDTTVFTGAGTNIGHATLANSSAGAVKDTAANPVVTKGAPGDWDNFGVTYPSVVVNGGNLNMWYTGIKAGPQAALTSFFTGNNGIATILAAGVGTNAKIGYASAVIPPPTTTTTTTTGGGGGGGGGGFGPPPLGYINVYNHISPSGIVTDDLTGTSSDNLVTLTIPKGTVGLTADGRAISQISIFPADPQPALTAGFKIFGIFYEMQPSGATFNPAITISFSYKGLTLPAGVNESDITAGWLDAQGKFNTLTSTVDTVNKIVTVQISHFTMFGLATPSGVVTTTTPSVPVPVAFTTTKFTISPSQALVNQAVTVSVLVTNTSNAGSTFSIDLKTDGTVTSTQTIILAGGASGTVTFNVTKPTAGTFTIGIGGDSGKLIVSDVPVISTPTGKPAAFSTSNLLITPTQMKPGDIATVNVTVTNTGDRQGTYIVALKVNGLTEDSHQVTLRGGETQNVNFSVTKNQAGNYAIGVDTLSATLVVQAPMNTTPVVSTTPAQKNNTPIIIGAIIGAILGLFLALLLVQYMIRPATFSMSGLSIMPALVTPGATAHVNVKVTNTGNKHGTYKVTMKVNGVIEGSQDVTLQKGSNQVVGFTVVKNNPGIYMISIDNVSGRLVVQDQSGEESPPTDKIKPRNWPDLFH
jgi:hypothetical protein